MIMIQMMMVVILLITLLRKDCCEGEVQPYRKKHNRSIYKIILYSWLARLDKMLNVKIEYHDLSFIKASSIERDLL